VHTVLMQEKVCAHCKNKFFTPKKNGKFCSSRCFGLSRVAFVVAANKARRKYPAMTGLSRHQIYYRHNHKSREYQLAKDRNIHTSVINLLGGKCTHCGFDKDVRALTLDHKNSDGSEDRKKNGSKIARYYILHPEEARERLQVLCANCNKIKAIDKKEHYRSRRVVLA